MNRDIGSRKEKIESKGAYSYDLHKAIRAVNSAQREGDLEKIGRCLEALRDICAPEIREAVNEEWLRIDRKYHDTLKRFKNAEFKAEAGLSGWGKDRYSGEETNTYYIPVEVHASPHLKKQLEENARNKILCKLWNEIFHARLQACIDCLNDHGELRKWREVEYGRI